jgi:hypothetical protein
VAHPRTNRQVERVNNMVLQRLKPRIFNRLKKFVGRWVAKSLRTSPSQATGFTPFFMVYGSRRCSRLTWTMERPGSRHTTSKE